MRPFCDKKDPLPISMQETEPDNSRMLEALEKKIAASKKHMADAISFGQYRKDGGSNV